MLALLSFDVEAHTICGHASYGFVEIAIAPERFAPFIVIVAENLELKRQIKEMQDTITAFKNAIDVLRDYYGEDVLLLDPKTFKVVKVARKVLPPIE